MSAKNHLAEVLQKYYTLRVYIYPNSSTKALSKAQADLDKVALSAQEWLDSQPNMDLPSGAQPFEVARLEKELESNKKIIATLEQTNKDTNTVVTNLLRKNKELIEERNQLNKQLEDFRSSSQRAQDTIRDLTGQLRDSDDEFVALERKVGTLQEQNEKLKKERNLRSTGRSRLALLEKIDGLKAKVSDLDLENNNLKVELKEKKADWDSRVVELVAGRATLVVELASLQDPKWRDQEGRVLTPPQFDEQHLLNTIRFIERSAQVVPSKIYPHLLAEARKRGLVALKDETRDGMEHKELGQLLDLEAEVERLEQLIDKTKKVANKIGDTVWVFGRKAKT